MSVDSAVTLDDGTRLGYTEVGAPDGAPVLFFHGTPGSRLDVTVGLEEDAHRLGLRLVAADRPGCGESPFVGYRVRDCPRLMAGLLDALGIGEVAVVGFSGGGRYAAAIAAELPGRVRRAALVSSTAPSDLPGVRSTWSKEDRMVYGLAVRAPWLLRAYLAKLSRDMRRDPRALLKLFSDLSAPDRAVLDRPGTPEALQRVVGEALRPGTRGVAHDFALEARPWGVDLRGIRVPVDVWHGDDDSIVSPQQGRILAGAIPGARLHPVPGEGHLSMRLDRAADVLEPLA
ncbi:alpha/beta hydrolase [Geodermatophilus sp. YIM 151500]|uniref:alpha/beta fold hydrolase n=1 Tax=Geodermatophilus sp. YIM 151500 TaxID=2984531 RepID=UPI0021E43E7F|nr:alpha/beta hydrolase [Geodermatophilus sp. YIM 151500]MCV2490757.1 alpha/beta hydrolase [Geodermatophilus sp. YIM 151500]